MIKTSKITVLIILATISLISFSQVNRAEIIEKIYAVVNGELITYSELKNSEIEMTRMLQQQFADDAQQLQQKVAELKKNLLNQLVDQKVVLSVAKEKKYDVEHEVEVIIKDIKKQYNINSDDELKSTIAAQGMNYDEWKKQLKEQSMQYRLIREEIGYKIKIDNAQIMAYYKENIKEYTKPLEYSLNCIYLDKAKHLNPAALSEKMQTIGTELKSTKFEEIAKKYSQLPGTENNYYLGRFKQGELQKEIETAAAALKKDEHSSWVETESGWYLVQLLERKESELIEYKTVRAQIENILRNREQDVKLKEYVVQLKKDSHIKIYEEYK